MKEWFSQLNQREQVSLILLSLALLLYLVYMFVWSPLDDNREDLVVQNVAVAESLVRVDAMVSELLQLRSGDGQAGAKRNLMNVINASTGRLQLPVSRLQPNSRGEIQVRLEGASFDDALRWLHEMEYQEGLLLRELSVTQTGTVGRVNITVRIAQAG
ncbi:MAG: type II secretion system protein GspM [Halioglobus sp.]|jgi:type II secretory pathway component PulM|nr:type II secretion system protein GspM [Halioglobus sp.]|tara:strand:+ start:25264 stop:25737 length:474 start_codon:yes stop_codon:yes gene_type:complete